LGSNKPKRRQQRHAWTNSRKRPKVTLRSARECAQSDKDRLQCASRSGLIAAEGSAEAAAPVAATAPVRAAKLHSSASKAQAAAASSSSRRGGSSSGCADNTRGHGFGYGYGASKRSGAVEKWNDQLNDLMGKEGTQ